MAEETKKKPPAKQADPQGQVVAKLGEAIEILDGMSGDVWHNVSERLAALRAAVEKHR